MCYAAPGPRCSGHTKAALTRAKLRVDEAHEAVNSTYEKVRRGKATDTDYRDANRVVQAAMDKRNVAQERYDASPEGILRLEESAARPEPQAAIRAHTRERLVIATRTRADQVAAYQAMHSASPRPEHENGPEQIDSLVPEIAAADAAHAAALTRQEHARVGRAQAISDRSDADGRRALFDPRYGDGLVAQAEYEEAVIVAADAQTLFDETRDETRVAWEKTMTARIVAVSRGELNKNGTAPETAAV